MLISEDNNKNGASADSFVYKYCIIRRLPKKSIVDNDADKCVLIYLVVEDSS
jgi:hypothetical protein